MFIFYLKYFKISNIIHYIEEEFIFILELLLFLK